MIQQTSLDFVHTRENNPVSQEILDSKRHSLNSQVVKVMRLLADGCRLTFWGAYSIHGIGDLRRRIKDIEDFFNIKAERKYADGSREATYWFNNEQKELAKEKLNKIKQ